MFTIHYYASVGDTASLENLLREKKVDVNQRGKASNQTALHNACITVHFGAVEILLQYNIDIYALNNHQNTAFWDLIMIASRTKKALMEANDGSTKKALEDKLDECLKIVELLLKHEQKLRRKNPEKFKDQPMLLNIRQDRLRERIEECLSGIFQKFSPIVPTTQTLHQMDASVETAESKAAGTTDGASQTEAKEASIIVAPLLPQISSYTATASQPHIQNKLHIETPELHQRKKLPEEKPLLSTSNKIKKSPNSSSSFGFFKNFLALLGVNNSHTGNSDQPQSQPPYLKLKGN